MAKKESTGERGVRKFVAENSLSLFFLAIFLAALVGQAIAGHSLYNQEQLEHNESAVSFWRYVGSSHFAQAVTENWQSETCSSRSSHWPRSGCSRRLARIEGARPAWNRNGQGAEGRPTRHEGIARLGSSGRLANEALFELLLIVMALVFLFSWFAQSVSGWSELNDQQALHGTARVSWFSYIGSSDFSEATFQNWQSEFLAVGSFAGLTVYLRSAGPRSRNRWVRRRRWDPDRKADDQAQTLSAGPGRS